MSDKLSSQLSQQELHEVRALNSVTSRHAGTVNYINPNEVANEDELLAQIGYRSQLNRTYSVFQCFGIAFSIMGLLPSIASTVIGGLSGGPASLLWGWFIAGIFILTIGYAMSELASAIPTSGGLYYWTYYYAPPSLKAPLSFVIGVTNSIALCGGVCSITYGLAIQILSAAFIARDGDFTITNGMSYGVFAACIVLEIGVTTFSSKFSAQLQTVSIIANNLLIVIFLIALPIGTSKNASFNDGKFIFGKFENFSDWTDGWAFLQFGLMPAVWTIGAFDSCVHMSEEVKNPSKAVPIGILGSISACWIMGFFIMIVINACISPDIESVISTASGQPLAQIFYDSLGKNWAVAFISLSAFCQFLMGSSIVIAVSRQVWAFARDDGLPFSSLIKVVNKKLAVPLRAIWFSGIVSLLLGLLILIGSAAANALFSVAVIGNYVSWMTPTILRFTTGRDLFKPGKFYGGPLLSSIFGITSVVFQISIIILACFPSDKAVEKDTMNYAVVINSGVCILSLVYYYVYKRKIYTGPKSDLSDADYVDAVNPSDDFIDTVLQNKEKDV